MAVHCALVSTLAPVTHFVDDCLGLFGVEDGMIWTKYFEMYLKSRSDEVCLGVTTGWFSLRGRSRLCRGWSACTSGSY